LADLPDQTLKPRESLREAQALLATHERAVTALHALVARPRQDLQAAEALTASLETAARSGDPRAVTDFGAHTLRLLDLRKQLDAAETMYARDLPMAEADLRSSQGGVGACQAAILTAKYRNGIELYRARVAEANLLALGEYVQRMAAEAGISIGADWREHPGLLTRQTPNQLGERLELHLSHEIEDFEAARNSAPTAPVHPPGNGSAHVNSH
jgi:hypothetical protein